jgi:hypothetical protein
VGGGALTPGLIPALADAFAIPEHKVGIRLPALIRGFRDLTGKLQGSEAVTPVGIALMTERADGLRFIDVEVNSRKVSLLDFEQKKDVLGALTLSGALSEMKLHGRTGLALTYTMNGEFKVIKGTLGAPAVITRNGDPVGSLSEKIESGDRIAFAGAIDGEDAACRLKDAVELRPLRVFCNGQGLELWPKVLVNGAPASPGGLIEDRAVIEVKAPSASEALELSAVRTENLSQRQVLVNINGSPRIVTQKNFSLLLNKAPCDLDAGLSDGDSIEFSPETSSYYRIRDLVGISSPDAEKVHVTVDGRAIELVLEGVQVYMNGQRVNPEEFIIDGADIRVYRAKDRKVMLSEIFKYIELDPQSIKGKRLRIFVNDEPAGFTTPLTEGSRVSIRLEDR